MSLLMFTHVAIWAIIMYILEGADHLNLNLQKILHKPLVFYF
jgi:hypothetical protein